ncbi:hypothetical protein Tco_1256758 [Tanacetum coccineum]
MTDAAKADVEKTTEEKGDAELAGNAMTSNYQVKESTEFPLPSSSLSVSSGFVPTVVEHYLGSKIGDDLQKVLQRHTADLIQKYSVKLTPEPSKIQKPTIDLVPESEKSASEIFKIKKEQAKKQKMPKYTIKSTNKAALKEYDLKSALYQTMNENKSFNRNPANHALYHALMEALIEDENAMDKGVANTVKNHKRQHDDDKDDDEDPSAGLNQGKKTKRRRTKELESSMKPSTTKETSKDKLDWNNPEGDLCPFELTKPLPLKGRPGHLTVVAEYFFNNDLEFLKSFDPEKKYTTSITKTKAARYEIVGIENMKILGVKSVSVKKLHGYGHLEEIVVKRADRQLYKFKEGDFVDLHLNTIEDMLLFVVQHKLFHLDGSEILPEETNINEPQKTFPEIEFKEFYTPSHKPPAVIYGDLNKQKRVMRADALYKFLDRTLKTIRDMLHHIILDFCLGYNKEMSRRKCMATDKRMSELMVEIIDKQLREKRIIQNLERLVGARELEMDYKLMTHTV